MTEHRPTTVAAFDFDGTLTSRDTVVPFLRLLAGSRALAGGLALSSRRVVPAIARRDRDALRSVATDRVFRGRAIDEVETRAATYGEAIHRSWLRPDTTDRLRWHLDEGHRVVVVSASYEQYVRVVGDRLGVEAVLATRLEVGPDDMCTGRLLGPNCRGAEKVARLHAWFDEQGLSRDDLVLWAYGDSAGDRDLLASADHPNWVTDRLTSVPGTD